MNQATVTTATHTMQDLGALFAGEEWGDPVNEFTIRLEQIKDLLNLSVDAYQRNHKVVNLLSLAIDWVDQCHQLFVDRDLEAKMHGDVRDDINMRLTGMKTMVDLGRREFECEGSIITVLSIVDELLGREIWLMAAMESRQQ